MKSSENTPSGGARVLLTGGTGFVGRHLSPALASAGYEVRCTTRDVEKARQRWPENEWVQGDLSDPVQLVDALASCKAAFYLVHSMAENDPDYRKTEVENARQFAEAAATSGVERVVYLGGVAPPGSRSEHLRSRIEVGETLRAGPVPTLELRASMIVGHGSLSWLIVRDLAARLPAMVLPRWLNSRTQPVAIEDVVLALVGALDAPLIQSCWYDIPGPDIFQAREILALTAELMGRPRPIMIRVPILTPRLSSHWVHFVTRADWSVAREIVLGLAEDLLAHDDQYWNLIGHQNRLSFAEAATCALEAESGDPEPQGGWATVERLLKPNRRR